MPDAYQWKPIDRILVEEDGGEDWLAGVEVYEKDNKALRCQYEQLLFGRTPSLNPGETERLRGRIERYEEQILNVSRTMKGVRQQVAEVAGAEISMVIIRYSMQQHLNEFLCEAIVLFGEMPNHDR